MKTKNFFPLFVDLEEKRIVVAGAGVVATRRVRTLVQFTDNIYVIAPQVTDEMENMAIKGMIHLERRPVKRQDFSLAYMVIAATNDKRLNDDIYRVCKEQGIYVNVASDRSKCDFYFPGIIKRDEVVIGINASGVNHVKAKEVRLQMEEFFQLKAAMDKKKKDGERSS